MMMMQATTLYCLVTEYASGGELLAYIKSQKDCRLGESASRPFIRQLLSAIFYLHERGIVHRYFTPPHLSVVIYSSRTRFFENPTKRDFLRIFEVAFKNVIQTFLVSEP